MSKPIRTIIAVFLLVALAAGTAVTVRASVQATNSALVAASTPTTAGFELNQGNSMDVALTGQALGTSASSLLGTNAGAQAGAQTRSFDWSTLISLAFGVAGLLWIRRRSAAL